MSSSNAFHQHVLHHCDPDMLPSDLVYDYYAAAWEGPQGRLEVCVIIMIMIINNHGHHHHRDHHQDALVVTNPDYVDEMVSSADYSQQPSEDGDNPPPVQATKSLFEFECLAQKRTTFTCGGFM